MASRLKREISLFSAIIYGVGIILGAGIYALVGEAAGIAGNAVWASFLLAAIVSSFTGMSYMELVSVFPKAAAEYVYVKKAFNRKTLAFVIGFFTVAVSIISASTVSLGFGGYMQSLLGIPMIPAALGLIVLLTAINMMGISKSSKMNIIFTAVEIAGLVIIICIAFFSGSVGSVNYFETPAGITGIISAAALIFFAYIGFEELANITEEVKNPRRNVPIALIASVIITTVLYILVSVSVVSLMNWEDLGCSTAPLSDAASAVLGGNSFTMMSVIALFATANTVLISFIVASRAIYGMSRDSSMPKVLCRVSAKTGAPWVALLVVMAASLAFVMIGDIKTVASITDFGVFLIFISVNISAIVLRYRMPNLKRRFKTPLNIGKFPLIPLFGLLSSLLLLSHLSVESLIVSALMVVVSVLLYTLYEKRRGR